MKTLSIAALVFLVLVPCAQAQVQISGLSNRSYYGDEVTFSIEALAGHSYDARLDGEPVPAGAPVRVTDVDYHELVVSQTNDTTLAVDHAFVQFIVRATERGHSEDGIPPHTPYPRIPSTTAEFAGAHLRCLVPASYPAGMDIPVVVWAVDPGNHAVRVNGTVTATGQPSFELFRGVGSGFLVNTGGTDTLSFSPAVGGLSTNLAVAVESAPGWTRVGGLLEGVVAWPEDARIAVTNHLTLDVGATLTVGAGAVVRVDPGVNITNHAEVVINGTLARPVVFAPVTRAQPWGGFIMYDDLGSVEGTAVIFTGSGADPAWFGANGNPGSHRKEQALFFLGGDQAVTLSDAAAIDLAGQLGHSVYGGDIRLTRFLLQRATTGGEFTGASFAVNDSAFVGFPDATADFEDGDHDALYIVSGTHGFTNTLFGWTKDDGVDSGAGGSGLLAFEACWFEAIFHDANALSGDGKIVHHRRCVFLNCGQGLESGYGAPEGLLEGCLATGNLTGGRFADNYDWGYAGTLVATNSLLIHNYRDVWGMNWVDWLWRTNQMTVAGNWFTAPIPEHPDNLVWDPRVDGWRLAAFMTTPPPAPVGVGLAVHSARFAPDVYAEGVPVGLSSFTTNPVSVHYAYQASGTVEASGTLQFQPGETVKHIPSPPAMPPGGILRLVLTDAMNGEITGLREAWFIDAPAPLVPAGSVWRYLDTGAEGGTAWREAHYPDAAWAVGPAELGYGEEDEATVVGYGPDADQKYITTYFRHLFNLADPSSIGGLTLRLKRDDGGIVYLNGQEIFRSNMPDDPVDYLTPAADNADDDGKLFHTTEVSPALLALGTNVLAVEIHQRDGSSSDVSFDCELISTALPVIQGAWFGGDWVLYWADDAYRLEGASVLDGPWRELGTYGPYTVEGTELREFFRLKKP